VRALVVGCTGFIGRQVGAAFRAAEPNAYIVGAARSPVESALFDRLMPIDLRRRDDTLPRLVAEAKPDVVVNCVGVLSNDLAVATAVNETAARDLIDACAAEAPDALFIHIGSSAEYAPLAATRRTREDSPEAPVSVYGQTKLQGTRAILRAGVAGHPPAVVLRFFNVLGPGMSAATMPGRVIEFVQHGVEPELQVGNLDAYRDFLDVRDAARAVTQAVSRRERLAGEVINVGSGHARPSRDVALGIVARSPRPVRLVESDAGSARSAGVSWQEADPHKAERLLAWRPHYSWTATLDHLLAGEAVR
jgi:nucleoside-diphosphate-sugar epimerase